MSAYKWRNVTTQNCGYTSSTCTWAVYYTLSYKVLDVQGEVVKEWTDIVHDQNLYSHTTGYYGCNCGCGHNEMPEPQNVGNDRIWTVAFTDGAFGILHKVDAGPYQYFTISPELEVSDPLVPDPEGVMREPKLCTLANDQVMVVYHDVDYAVKARFMDKSGQPSGDPLPVSDVGAGHQKMAVCKGFADGKSVVSFSSCAAGGPCQVHAQVLKPTGAALGPTVTASQTGDGTLRTAGRPLTFSDGSFALVWEEAGADADGYAALARLYDKSLNAFGEPFRLHKGQDNDQRGPVLVANVDDFIAFWDWRIEGALYDPFFRKFDAEGGDLEGTPERQLSAGMDGQQTNGDVVGMDGGFAAVWESENLDGDQSGVALRLFDNDGVPLSDDLQVNQTAPGQQSDPAVAWQEATGNMLVTWTADGQSNGTGVFGRLLTSDGGALSPETKISEGVEGPEVYSDVAALSGGKYVAVWQGYANLFFLTQVYGVVLDDSGALTGLPFVVNQTSAGDQVAPAVAATGGDNPGYVIAWTQNGDDAAVLARKFYLDDTPASAETVLDTFGNPEQVTLDWFEDQLLVCWLAGGKTICQALDWQLAPLGGQTEPVAEGEPANPLVLFRDAETVWLAFDSPRDSEGRAVVRQQLQPAGAVDAASALLNWTEAGDQTAPFAARLSNNRAVVGWADSENDGDGLGLYFRILD